jgi:phytoene dehydrogenase-like protein
MKQEQGYDVVVIGSGVGGLIAASRLVLEGYRPLVLEAEDRVGGRFSTIEKDGYKLPTGAIAIETGGPFYESFAEMGIDPDLRMPDPPVLIRVRGKNLKPGAPVWDHMIKRVTKTAGRVVEGLSKAREGELEEDISLEEWTRRHTRSKTLLGVFQSLACAIFTVNADELPARAFFRHLRETGAYKRFGYAPRGNVEIAEKFVAAIEERGGEVRTGWRVRSIEIDDDGRATGVLAAGPDGEDVQIQATAVVSNVGPRNTAQMVSGSKVEDAFRDRVKDVQSTSMMVIAFSTDSEEIGHPGILNYTDTKRVCSVANLGTCCPELAPPGRTLYEAYACPRPAVGDDFDLDAERALMEQDMHKIYPNYDKAEVILFKCMQGMNAPAQQAVPGKDLEVQTPVANLVDVGDGVKPYGWIGTTACAHTARTAVAALLDNGVLTGSSPAPVAGS